MNYAQWETAEAYQARLANPVAKEHMAQAAAISESFDPHLYGVAWSITVEGQSEVTPSTR